MPKITQCLQDIAEAGSIKFNNIVYEMKEAGRHVDVMSFGEAYFDIPLFPFDDLPFPDIYHYSHSRGLPDLRRKFAAYLREEHDVPCDPKSEMVITSGSKAAIHMAFMSILDPGDEVIVFEPAWVSYTEQVKLCRAIPVPVPWDRRIWDVEAYMTNKTRAVVITTPHNPRGYVYSSAEIEYLLKLAEQHDFWLLSDEGYCDFTRSGEFVSVGRIDREKSRSIVFNTISKSYGLSGWRIGYVLAQERLISQLLKINQHLLTCPPTILQHYLRRHFDDILAVTKPQIVALLDQRDALSKFMTEIGLECLAGTSTFYFFVSTKPSRLTSTEFFFRLLEEENISITPGIGFGKSCDGFVRVSIGTADLAASQNALRRIKALIDRTS